MGHERIGFLPKTQSWKSIVDQLAQFDNDPNSVSYIANQTLENIRALYKKMPYDESVVKAIQFLAILSTSAKKENQQVFLNENGLNLLDISLFTLARSAKEFIKTENGSLEINKIACDSVLEAMAKFEHKNKNLQNDLFNETKESIWNKIGSGSDFCELAREFFASFTDRHLQYYIDRETAHSINDFQKIENFREILNNQITQHSFETSKIMQSFAAGWFNKYGVENIPSKGEISNFLKLAFEKMREEFRREVAKK